MTSSQESVLIVVDVQNYFVHEGGVFVNTGLDLSAMQASVDRLLPLIDTARSAQVPSSSSKPITTAGTTPPPSTIAPSSRRPAPRSAPPGPGAPPTIGSSRPCSTTR